MSRAEDECSFSQPDLYRTRHLELELVVQFDRKTLIGTATLDLEPIGKREIKPLVLDTRGLTIKAVEASHDGTTWKPAPFQLGERHPIKGSALTISPSQAFQKVRVHYETGPESSALQWLNPSQTAGKKQPYLFTQSQAIDARSWVPLQDTPGIRFTYKARVKPPRGLMAVMGASQPEKPTEEGVFVFQMPQPIPSYLLALAVGDLGFRSLGPRTGVYAEPEVLAKAALEFADIEEMVKACESLYGPYQWGRFDVLVMPPSFPFGGMENPRLTFASPTTLAGDKSLVSLLAHELAHSWSGNLVCNATWRDFWLNEGFTVYLERRIMELVYGKQRAQWEALLGRRSLDKELLELAPDEQVLHVRLNGRNPNDFVTDIPYEKGCLFLLRLESVFGRENLDKFLKGYFSKFSFKSIKTEEFKEYIIKELFNKYPDKAQQISLKEWFDGPGLPKDAPNPVAEGYAKIEDLAKSFGKGDIGAAQIGARGWHTQEWLHFLRSLGKAGGLEAMAKLDGEYHLTQTGNSEIVAEWLLMAIQRGYEPAMDRLRTFLTDQGRRKFLKPLYQELVKTPEGKKRALAIYAQARPGYHPVSTETIDKILNWNEESSPPRR